MWSSCAWFSRKLSAMCAELFSSLVLFLFLILWGTHAPVCVCAWLLSIISAFKFPVSLGKVWYSNAKIRFSDEWSRWCRWSAASTDVEESGGLDLVKTRMCVGVDRWKEIVGTTDGFGLSGTCGLLIIADYRKQMTTVEFCKKNLCENPPHPRSSCPVLRSYSIHCPLSVTCDKGGS